MNVLIVTAVYPPEPVVSARLSHDLQAYLRSLGHKAEVLCPQPSRGLRGHSCMGDQADVDVFRIDSYHCAHSDLWGRARESWDFGQKSAQWLSHRKGQVDVLYANVWPLFGQLHIVAAARRLGIPVVMHVQDVYPESLDTKLPSWLYRLCAPLLLSMDRRTIQKCRSVVLISEKIRQAFATSRHIADRTAVVRNWVDASPFAVQHDAKSACRAYDIPADHFTFMYLGNISPLASLDTAIRAFSKIADKRIQLVIVGEGSHRKRCKALVRELKLSNVHFRSEPDPNKVALLQSMADAFVLPTRKGAATSSTPSKCISYMLSGKPVIAAVDAVSDTADDMRAADCALLCEPEDVDHMATAICSLAETPQHTLDAMGARARDYALREFSRDTCLPRLSAIIEGAVRP